jgi:hypothetical protein
MNHCYLIEDDEKKHLVKTWLKSKERALVYGVISMIFVIVTHQQPTLSCGCYLSGLLDGCSPRPGHTRLASRPIPLSRSQTSKTRAAAALLWSAAFTGIHQL